MKNSTHLRMKKMKQILGCPGENSTLASINKISLLFFLLLLITPLISQDIYAEAFNDVFQKEITIKGNVKDENGIPMIGVTVIEKGTTNGTQTDFDGNFSLDVQEGATLELSFVGYKTQDITKVTQSNSTLEIVMQTDVAGLDEVVVIGYGEQKKESVVAAVEQVEGEEVLKTGSTTNVTDALQGLAPSLTVTNSDGTPGYGAHDISIRGLGTWGNAYPLTIVDGVERDFNNIDPNEIESISILKDASATAIYGVRGANGVIMITTKKGKTGEPVINFSSNFSFKHPTKTKQNADYLTTMAMYNEAAANDGLWENIIPESEIDAWRQNIGQAGPYNDYFPQIDWWDELFRKYGTQQQYNLNIRGGTQFMKYFGSVGYVHDGDIFRTNFGENKNPDFDSDFGFKRYNWRFNLDFDLTKTTDLSIGFAGNFRKKLNPVWGPYNFFGNMRSIPTNVFPIRYSDGEWGDSPGGGDNYLLLLTSGGQETYKTFQGFYDATLKQRLNFITKGLSVEGKISLDTDSNYFSEVFTDNSRNGNSANIGTIRYYRQYDYSNPIVNEDGSVEYPLITEYRFPSDQYQDGRPVTTNHDEFRGYGRKLFYQFSMNYKRDFGKHAVSALALVNRQKETRSYSSVNFPFPTFREDWVGRVTYGYDDKYLLEVNGAYTGSEKFAAGKRFGFFPSYSVGWVASKESFIKKFAGEWLNFLKFRYSQGEMGSDLGAPRFAYTQLYTTSGKVFFGYNNLTEYGPLYYEGQAANPNETWETSFKRDLGIDINLWGKLSGTLDLYDEKRDGILMNLRTVPVWFGAQEPSGNIGKTKNRGYEAQLTWEDKIGSDFTYSISANLSQFENRIVFYDDPRLQDDYLKYAGKPIRWDRQAPLVINSGYYNSLDDIYNGSHPNMGASMDKLRPGDLYYVDYNGDGITDTQDKVAMKDQLYPRTIYGLNLGAGYKGFELTARFYGVSDVGRTFQPPLLWDFNGGLRMAQTDVTSRWTPETAATAGKPTLHLGGANAHNASLSSFIYRDGSYLRLKTVEASYNFHSGAVKRFGVDKLQVYANGNNLWTWVKEDNGLDPEAFGAYTYPVVKRYNLGLRVAF